MQLVNEWYRFIDDDVLDKETCDKIIALGTDWTDGSVDTRSGKYSDEERVAGPIQEPGVAKKKRISDVCWIQEQWVFDLVFGYMLQANENSAWKFQIDSCESCQLTRYGVGGFYTWHRDGRSDHLSKYDIPDSPYLHGKVRKLSMTLVLNDDFEGGDFQISKENGEDVVISTLEEERGRGSIIVFPSFTMHRITPVTKGIRHSLVVWFLGPPFK